MKYFSRVLTMVCSTVYFSMAGMAAMADDTEIFFTEKGATVKPNIMFILDTSGSMVNNSVVTDGVSQTRLKVMQDATTGLIDELTGVNVGLMSFGGSDGAYFEAPVAELETQAQKDALKATVNALTGSGGTPLSEALFESMRYYQGTTPFVRSTSSTGGQVSGVRDGDVFDSPIEYSCQPNYAVLLTDGEPTNDTNKQSTIEGVVGTCTDNCLDEVADYMFTEDMIPSASDPSDSFPGQQKIRTYTVGFELDSTLLSSTATKGGGQFVRADNTAELKAAFLKIIDDVNAKSTTYAAPGVAVNTFDRLNHLNMLYYALFQSDKGAIWNGNLKRYKLAIETDPDTGESEAVIVDVNGNAAIDQATGFFKDTSKSWWSLVVDGPNVKEGGAASVLPSNTSERKVFSNLQSNQADLSNSSNAIVTSNTNLTCADFGGCGTDTLADIISWTRGVDVNDADGDSDLTETRNFLADPLHSVPQLVIYDATATPQDISIFYGDNQGYIHAVNGNSGESHFSFMPRELLKNQPALMNSSEESSKIYGMDGTIAQWVYDKDRDGVLEALDGDFARIYGGMRRGGKSYYGLDVTDRTSPEFLWRITGGSASTNFKELGQSWSKPVKTKVKIANKLSEVLIFSGGYDVNQDSVDVRTSDSIGRALYIVDAETGNRLWWAGPTGSGANLELADMKYSIPASPKVLDINGDGLADQAYVGDMGGQIFRFDFTNGNKLTEFATAGRIANLAGGDAANNRRFYHSPDLFGIKIGGARYLGLSIGSGYQASPLDKVIDDRIYMLRIPDVSSAPVDPTDGTTVLYNTITESNLYDATDNLIQQGTNDEPDVAAKTLAGQQGWYIRLENDGEKVLSSSTTVNEEVFVTTYEPKVSSDPCLPPTGTSRLYHMSVVDARAVINYDGQGTIEALTKPDRYVELSTAGLPPSPQRMRVEDTDVICVGTECRTIDTVSGVVETFWYED
jgi:type IV pilus assembly protein PilY1